MKGLQTFLQSGSILWAFVEIFKAHIFYIFYIFIWLHFLVGVLPLASLLSTVNNLKTLHLSPTHPPRNLFL